MIPALEIDYKFMYFVFAVYNYHYSYLLSYQ